MTTARIEGDIENRYRKVMQHLAIRMEVSDIVPDHAEFVFLLESPHKAELKYGAPVSGASGQSMSKHLFGEAYARVPLGILVKENLGKASHGSQVSRIGLMNVCTIPMQQSAYGSELMPEAERELVGMLERLRKASNTGTYRDAAMHVVQTIVVDDLCSRLSALRDRPLHFVPCGRFAQKFFALADIHSPNWQVSPDIPHPSYNNWGKAMYADAIARLQAAFQLT